MSAAVGGGGHSHDGYPHHHVLPPPSRPYHLLEVTIISAQDLHPATCRISTYASAWVDSDHKLTSRVDTDGRTNPSWNDKFVFRVDEAFLRSDTSSVTIDIYAVAHLRRDPVVGTARLVLSTLNPSCSSNCCVPVQVRRPASLRPQGIVNVGIAILDDFINAMPLDPAFVLKDIVDSPNRSFPRSPSTPRDEEYWAAQPDHAAAKGRPSRLSRDSSDVGESEKDVLLSKLEKWRFELTPVHEKAQRKHGRTMTLPPCLCGGSTAE